MSLRAKQPATSSAKWKQPCDCRVAVLLAMTFPSEATMSLRAKRSNNVIASEAKQSVSGAGRCDERIPVESERAYRCTVCINRISAGIKAP